MNHITMHSGEKIHFVKCSDSHEFRVSIDGTPEDFIDSVAISLSRIPRFAGHTTEAWTVLDHSIAIEKYADLIGGCLRDRVYALLHDAHEAITGDIPTPVKLVIGSQIKDLQLSIDRAIYEKLSMNFPSSSIIEWVSKLDKDMFYAERELKTKNGIPAKTTHAKSIILNHGCRCNDNKDYYKKMVFALMGALSSAKSTE